MRSGWRTLAAVVLAVSAIACDDPAGVIQDKVEVVARLDEMSIRNGRDATIYFFAIDRQIAAAVDWFPCTNPAVCEGIRPGDTEVVPYADIVGQARSGEVVVFWWHLVEQGDAWTHDQMHSLLIRLGS
jgi:hypothetical protein